VKPITYKLAMKIWKEQKRVGNDPFAVIAPYPGKRPTRIYMRAGKWKYVGKPSVNAYRTFLKLIPKCPQDYSAIEFDQKSIVYGVKKANDRTWSIYHENLWGVYHPQTMATYQMSWMGYGIKTLGHRYVIGAAGIKGVR
jgi:hypothetical protein